MAFGYLDGSNVFDISKATAFSYNSSNCINSRTDKDVLKQGAEEVNGKWDLSFLTGKVGVDALGIGFCD